jgi:hypothetical protein
LIIYVPIVVMLAIVYLDIPSYLFAIGSVILPKYWYFCYFVICAPWIFLSLTGKNVSDSYPFNRWAAALVVLLGFHLLISSSEGDIERSKSIITSVQYVILAVLMGVTFSAIPRKTYAFSFPVLCLAIALLIIYDFLSPGTLYTYDLPTAVIGRGAGTFINPNRAGEALAITLFLSITVLRGVWLLVLFIFCGIALLLTFSRAAIVAWFLLLSIALFGKKLPRGAYAVVALAPFVIFALASNDVLTGALKASDASNDFDRLQFFQSLSVNDASPRERADALWAGIEKFMQHPFFGAGAASTQFWAGAGTHNEAVLLGAELGIFGLAIWAWLATILWNGDYLGKRQYHIALSLLFIYFSMFSHNLLGSVYAMLTYALVTQRQKSLGLTSYRD